MKNQPQHTQGEWKLRKTENDPDFLFEIMSGEISIGVVYNSGTSELSEQVNKANAHRIVTAVNEYETLKKKADMHDELLLLAKTISEALHDKEEKKLSVFEMSILHASDTLLKKAIQK